MILENTVIEAAKGYSVVIGFRAIISHGAIIHGASIGKGTIVGIGAIVLDQANVSDNVVIGAAALVSPGKESPSEKLVLGIPGKIVRDLSTEDLENNAYEWSLLEKKVEKYSQARMHRGAGLIDDRQAVESFFLLFLPAMLFRIGPGSNFIGPQEIWVKEYFTYRYEGTKKH